MGVVEIIFLLHKIYARSSNNFFTTSLVFHPRLLFNIQRASQISNTKQLPLMF
jgi:hypothetical protein